jgi:alkane 1-monooxygenase
MTTIAQTNNIAESAFRVWLKHLLCLSLPLLSFGFLATGPHGWMEALAWFAPAPLLVFLDRGGSKALRQPSPDLPQAPFNALLYILTAMQFLNMALMGRLFYLGDFWSLDTLVTFLLVGGNSGFSAIVVAHELIHRRQKRFQRMGRALLCTVMYEHFYTEHLRGHHVRVGTPGDPATARFGERFWPFYRRTTPAQFRSAWRIETARLGDIDMSLWDQRQLQNSVVHGLVAEWLFAFGMLALFGWGAFIIFLLQAWRASMLLEVVNYFEHWGLVREGKRVRPIDSWDTDSAFTLHALVGLSRHADHHAHAARPFQQLRHFEESPKLPRGYIGMVELILVNNAWVIEQMTEELKRRRLGPFADPTPVSATS